MTYREPSIPEPADAGCIDPRELAALVDCRDEKAVAEQRTAEQRRRARQRAMEEKARLRPARVTVERDANGIRLTLARQSVATGVLIASTFGVGVWFAATVAAVVAAPVDVAIFITLMLAACIGPFVAPPLVVSLMRRRALHLYVADNGYFVLFRRTPKRPHAMGRANELELDIRREGQGLHTMMIERRRRDLLEHGCDRLGPRDISKIRAFAAAAKIRVDD